MKPARQSQASQSWTLDLGRAPSVKADPFCIGVAENLNPEQTLHFATELSITHICQKKGFLFEKELASSEMLIHSPENFLRFPVGSILAPGDVGLGSERSLTVMNEKFSASRRKREILDTLTNALESKGLSKTMVDDGVLVADELFTNAIYNAPFVDSQTQANPGVNRHTVDVEYNGGKTARVFMACDESRLVIGVEDPFGSLNLERYLKRIEETYSRGPAATMNLGPGGAGLGSYIIFSVGASLYFGVWPQQATVLCCVLPLGISNRARVELPKHLHWIQR